MIALLYMALLTGCSNLPMPSPAAKSPETGTVIIITPTHTLEPPTSTPIPTATPLPQGGNLTIALEQGIPLLQPWRPRSRNEEQVISLLYRGLMRLDEQLRPEPDVAETWNASADGRIVTFTLRSDVTWHDGQPLDAVDVHFTLDRMQALPFTTTALLADLQHIAAISTPDSHTVVLSLTERYSPLLAELTLPILPRHLLENEEIGNVNFWDIPVGCGPFQFDQRERGASIVLSRYSGYYGGEPLLERVVFVGASDVEKKLAALQEGELLLAELPWNASQNVPETHPMLRMDMYPENGFYFLAFNLREGRPFADVQVRQALAKAIDLPHLVKTMTKGQGTLIGNSAVPGSWADLVPTPDEAPDLDEARALLQEAGWTLPAGATIRQRDGITFDAQLFVRGDDVRRLAAAKHIAEIASSIGLQVTVEAADFPTTIVSKYAPPYDFDMLLGSWGNGAGDPLFTDFMYYDPDDFRLFHSSQINLGTLDTRVTRNFVEFRDSAYDTHAQMARQLYHIEERMSAQRKAQERIATTLPYLYLWADRIPVVLNKRVTTLDGPVDLSMPNYLRNIERWYLEDTSDLSEEQ